MEYGGRKMSWAKAAVARGLVFLSGVEGRDMETDEAPPTMRAHGYAVRSSFSVTF